MPVITVIAGDLSTGRIRQRNLPVRTASFENVLNGAGTVSASIALPMIDPNTQIPVDLPSQLHEGASFLGYIVDGALLAAGPIWSSTYDSDSRVWSLAAAGLRSYFDYRLILPALVDSDLTSLPGATAVTYSNVALRTIAKRLLSDAIAVTGGSVPIDFEADIAGTNTRTYDPLTMKHVNDALNDLSGVINGPDIQLVPYLSADGNYVRWRLTTADEQHQAGADWVWDTSSPSPNATGVNVSRNATTLATTAYAIGATTQGTTASDGTTTTSTTLTAKRHSNLLLNAGYLRMETSVAHTDVIDPATLQGYADDAAAAGKYYTDTYTVKARIDKQPLLVNLSPGDYAQIRTRQHPILGSGSVRVRVLSIGHTMGDFAASIACAPMRTAAV